ncbi:MAG: hypothetical protein QM770_00685 [Tepidisphaeraceae bacterium]
MKPQSKRVLLPALLATLALTTPSFAQAPAGAMPGMAPPAPPAVPVAPAPSANPNAAAAADPMLGELRFEDVALPDVINFLQEQSKQNIVLRGMPGIDLTAIRLSYRLKNVSLSQVLHLIASTPGTNIQVEDGPISTVTVVAVEPPAPVGVPPGVPGGFGGPPMAAPVATTGTASLLEVLSDSRLGEDAKAQTAAITALIDASIKTLGDDAGPPPSVYFHPQTGIVVYRGTPQQTMLLGELFNTLNTSAKQHASTTSKQEIEDLKRNLAMMEGRYRDAEVRSQEMRQRAADLEAQLVKANAELDYAKKAAAGLVPPGGSPERH